jgi:tryptophan halogenase
MSAGMDAADLMNLVHALAAPYGLERSVKIVRGALLQDRFLVSLHRAALGTDAAGKLLKIGRALGLPPEFAGASAAALADADIVHFGYEGGTEPATYKIYLEYASRVRRAQAQNASDPVLVHLAYKWTPEAVGRRTVTRYTWLPCRSEAALAQKLRMLAPVAEAPLSLRCGLALMSRAAKRTDPANLFLMEVKEPDNPRRSYDLNLYRAEMQVHDIADLLGAVASELAVPPPQLQALLEGSGARALGHFAGGRGHDGREFVTVYYGVEAH